jgi:DNA-binding NarL/FixJ family response regulator
LPSSPFRAAGGIGDGREVDNDEAPRVLLGNLGPIMLIGMARLLAEEGAEVIGQERHPAGILSAAGRLQPDVVVLDLNTEGSRDLSSRVQRVSPETKVILCDSDEDGMEVLDPGADTLRRVDAGGLRLELATSRTPR